jgi:hypothetical protein
MRTSLLCALSFALLSGCAAPKTRAIDPAALGSLKDQMVARTARATPTFGILSIGDAPFGWLGWLGGHAGMAEGNKVIAENHVADPSQAIAAALSKALEVGRGAHALAEPVFVDTGDAAQIAAIASAKARFVVDVETVNWGFLYFPTNWTHYRVLYKAKARLIDAETKAVVAEGFCRLLPEDSGNAPTYDELLAKDATMLKATLARYAVECARSLKREMLALGDTGDDAATVTAPASPAADREPALGEAAVAGTEQ